MKKRTNIFILLPALLAGIASCKKGEFAPDQYKASVSFLSSQLSTIKLELQLDGSGSRDSLVTGGTVAKDYYLTGKELTEGKRMTYKVYKAGTNEVIADTSFLLQQRTRQTFTVIYNETLSLSGFLGSSDVPKDSVKVRIRYIDNTAGKRFPKLQWECYQYKSTSPYYDPANNIAFTLLLNDGVPGQDITVPAFMKNNTTATRVMARLKNPETGTYLSFTAAIGVFDTGMKTNSNQFDAGNFYFYTATLTDKSGGLYNLPFTTQKL
jgi:hypothetical protein